MLSRLMARCGALVLAAGAAASASIRTSRQRSPGRPVRARRQPPGQNLSEPALHAPRGAARRDRSRRGRRSGARRAGAPLRGGVEPPAGASSTAWWRRAAARAARAPAFSCSAAHRSRSNASTSTARSRACAAISTASTWTCSGCAAAIIDRGEQRRSVMVALAQNNCGPQYRTAARAPGGFFDQLFGRDARTSPSERSRQSGRAERERSAPSACAPATDSISRSPMRPTRRAFAQDEKTCQRMCPASEVMLFSYPTEGGDIAQATSISGAALFVAAERVQVSSGVQRRVQLQAAGPKLGRRARQGRGGRARRRRGDGRARQADVAAAGAEGTGQGPHAGRGSAGGGAGRSVRRDADRPRPPRRTPASAPVRSVGPTFIAARRSSFQKSNASLFARCVARSPSRRASATACRDRGSG